MDTEMDTETLIHILCFGLSVRYKTRALDCQSIALPIMVDQAASCPASLALSICHQESRPRQTPSPPCPLTVKESPRLSICALVCFVFRPPEKIPQKFLIDFSPCTCMLSAKLKDFTEVLNG